MNVIPASLKIFWLGYLLAAFVPLILLYMNDKK